jgi:hypothetical protein
MGSPLAMMDALMRDNGGAGINPVALGKIKGNNASRASSSGGSTSNSRYCFFFLSDSIFSISIFLVIHSLCRVLDNYIFSAMRLH